MKFKILFIAASLISTIFITSCNKEKDDNEDDNQNAPAKLIIRLDVDSNQLRLGNLGSPETVPDGHGSQSPVFNSISAHYLELAQNSLTPLGDGEIIYHASETIEGGGSGIDFNQSIIVEPGGIFLEIPLSEVNSGSYEWARLSLSYQNYDISFRFNEIDLTGTLASFVGFNTYIEDLMVYENSVTLNENKEQGYWAFETLGNITQGQAPEGATTVPNPLSNTSPIPVGSCVVTGEFEPSFIITGNETEDINITLSLSTNQSFEWVDDNANGLWDVGIGSTESVVDMGLRGLIPMVTD